MTSLDTVRNTIRHLLDERHPAHAMAAYYALNHPDDRTTLSAWPQESETAEGYLCLSMTGLDLFRPLLTGSLPPRMDDAVSLFYHAMPPGASLLITAPVADRPLISALFDLERESPIRLFDYRKPVTDPGINVLVTRETTPAGWPRYVVQQPDPKTDRNRPVASAQINWQGRYYAEISVQTVAGYQRRGFARAVINALIANIQDSGRTPLFRVEMSNQASLELANAVGFKPTGFEFMMLEATLREKPAGIL